MNQEVSWINDMDFSSSEGMSQLSNIAMNRICRYLPTHGDLLEFALTNRHCSAAALPVLWESPCLHVPKKLESFLHTVGSRKNLALHVKEITLCLRNHDSPTVFQPVLDSADSRHQTDILLTAPRLIMHMVQKCESAEKLKIYGWKLDPIKIESIGASLSQLKSLTIIGANESFQRPFVIRSMVSRLRELRLDGDFCISMEFANTLATRAHALRSLEIPLCYGKMRMEKPALARLCSGKPGELNLTELKLTYASPMQDEDVENVLAAFPNLRSFTLHGTTIVTAGIISTAIIKCQYIESIELRCHPDTIVRQAQRPSNQPYKKPWVAASRLKRLLLEYAVLPGDLMEDLTQSCNALTTIGLSNCLHLTDKALVQLIECNENLQTLHIIQCGLITDQTLKGLNASSASRSLEDVYIKQCGSISPRAVFLFCCATTRYRLKHLCFEGYPNLSSSILGTFAPPNENTKSDGWGGLVRLDERAIDALASTDTQLNPDLLDIPKDCSLTGEQLILLAKELSIHTDTLTNAIQKIQNECPMDENNRDSESEQASTNERFGQSVKNKSLSRISSMNSQHALRPETPALWARANKSDIQQYLPSPTAMDDGDNRTVVTATSRSSRHSHRYSSIITPEPEPGTEAESEEPEIDDNDDNDEDNDYDYDDGDEPFAESARQITHSSFPSDGRSPTPSLSENRDMTFVDEPFSAPPASVATGTITSYREEWPTPATNTGTSIKKKTTNNDLGGWGSTQTAWSQKAQPTPRYSELPPMQHPKQDRPWAPYTAKDQEQDWIQQAYEPSAPFQRGGRKMGRNLLTMESDGWGTANSYCPWDAKEQGYVQDLINKQKSTQFWNGQKYISSQDTAPVKAKNGAAPSMQPPVSAPTLPSDNALPGDTNLSNSLWPTLDQANASGQQQPPSTQGPSKRAPENTHRFSRLREPNPLSSDEENIEWEEEYDGIIIKTSPDFRPQIQNRAPAAQPQPARAHAKSLSEGTRNVRSTPVRPMDDNIAEWNDFASLPMEEQVARQDQMAKDHQNETAAATTSTRSKQAPSFDPQSGFLIDTSDVVSKSTSFDSKPKSSIQPTSLHSSVWDEVSALKIDNSPYSPPVPSVHQQKQQQLSSSPGSAASHYDVKTDPLQNNISNNNLLDNTEEDLLSPTENNTDMTTIQQPLTPQVNNGNSSPSALEVGINDSLEEALFNTPLSSEGGMSTPSRQSPSQKPEAENDPDTDPRGKRLGSFKISIPDKGECVLRIYMNVTPEESAREFCDTNGIPDMYDRVLSLIKKEYDNLKTKKIFQSKSGKKKKSSKKKVSSNTDNNISQS